MNLHFTLERLERADIEAVTLAEMKEHLRVDYTEADGQIAALITGAAEWVEDFTGRALIDQTWRLNIGENVEPLAAQPVPGSYSGTWVMSGAEGILLRKSPVIEILSVVSVGTEEETTIDPDNWVLRDASSKWPRIVGLPTGTDLRIEFRAGYADLLADPAQGPEEVPERFKAAMKLWAEANFDRDEKMMEKMLDVAERLVRPERVEIQFA